MGACLTSFQRICNWPLSLFIESRVFPPDVETGLDVGSGLMSSDTVVLSENDKKKVRIQNSSIIHDCVHSLK